MGKWKNFYKYLSYSVSLIIIILVILFSGIYIKPKQFFKEQLKKSIPVQILKEANYWTNIDGGVKCQLCPFYCFLPEGQKGKCQVRINTGGTLYTMVYAQPCSMNVDPIEKKTIFHYLPGSSVFSVTTAGCNLSCNFCQNWTISQANPEDTKAEIVTPKEIVELAKTYNCKSIAYTSSEPIVFYEYVLETAKLARKSGLKNILVSCGFINEAPMEKLADYLDIVKIDLKGFDEKFNEEICGSNLKPVLNTLKLLRKKGVFVEVVNLVVPSLNDKNEDFERLSKWIFENMGANTPLFFSRFSPQYKLQNLPPTPVSTLEMAIKIAKDIGLNYVYIGNVPGHTYENTFCPKCGKIVIGRYGFEITEFNVVKGRCKFCGEKIYGIWE